jgi:hypothetical protein
LLRFELIELSLLPFDLGLLHRHPPLYFFVLLLTSLHLIADQSSPEKSYGSTDTGTGAGVSGSTSDDGAQTCPAKSSDRSAFFPRRKRLRAAEKNNRKRHCRHGRYSFLHGHLLKL